MPHHLPHNSLITPNGILAASTSHALHNHPCSAAYPSRVIMGGGLDGTSGRGSSLKEEAYKKRLAILRPIANLYGKAQD
jgi:hypothetical protein